MTIEDDWLMNKQDSFSTNPAGLTGLLNEKGVYCSVGLETNSGQLATDLFNAFTLIELQFLQVNYYNAFTVQSKCK